jgi:Tol biopolymer transport system component
MKNSILFLFAAAATLVTASITMAMELPSNPTLPEKNPPPVPVETKSSFTANTHQLTFVGPRAGEGYFSADGNKMIFQSERSSDNPFYQMFVMDLKTGKTNRLSPGYGQTTCGWIKPNMKKAIWSSTHLDPNWKKTQEVELAQRKNPVQKRYSWSFDPSYDIFESDLQGQHIKQLTKSKGYDAESSYSPDGQWIAFASNRSGYEPGLSDEEKKLFEKDPSSQMEIYIMKSDGSDVRRLTRALGYDGGPFFSHDGKKITWRRFSTDGMTAEIWTMNVDGSEQKQITHIGKMSWAPFFHPSGDYIIFASNIEGFSNFELYLVDAQGNHDPVRVTYDPGFDGLASFSPDGSQVTWTHRNSSGESQIYLADWNDEAARKAIGLKPTLPSLLSLSPEIKQVDLKSWIQYLASPEMDGRATGSAQEKIYAGQIASLFKTWGLVPAPGFTDYFQDFDFVSGIKFGPQNSLSFDFGDGKKKDPSLENLKVSEAFEPLSLSKTGVTESAPVVFAGYGLRAPATDKIAAYDSYENLDVKGKWVLVLQDVPQNVANDIRFHYNQFSRPEFKATVAKTEGAIGLLIATGAETLAIEKWGKPRLDGNPQDSSIPVIKISTQTLEKLFEHSSLKALDVQKALDAGTSKKVPELKGLKAQAQVDLILEHSRGRNVVGVLKAMTPGKHPALLIGAHGDHLGHGLSGNSLAKSDEQDQIHYGADDNASGVSVVLELAHSLENEKRKNGFKKDIYFAVWSGEELGLLGSKAWIKEWTAKNGSLSQTFAADLNLDMVGRLRDKLLVQSTGSSPAWAPLFEELSIRNSMPISLQDDPFLPTDSTSFYLEKVPAITFFTGAHSEYHTPRDKPETINYAGLEKIANLSQSWAQSLAMTKDKIAYKEVPQSHKTMSRTFRIFLGTIPDYSQDQVKGVRLGGVSKDSPAEKGGLKSQDVIVELAGQKIENLYDYTYILQNLKPGAEVPVKIMRLGEIQELKITPALKE